MSGIRLRQLPNGKWYKFGEGPPVEAAVEEIALWQMAQEVVMEEVGVARRPWQRVVDLAKWGTLFTAASGFLVVYLDSAYIAALYSGLGLRHYKVPMFSPSPVNGVQLLVQIIAHAGVSILWAWVAYRILSLVFEVHQYAHSIRTVLVFVLGIFSVIGLGGIITVVASTPVLPLSPDEVLWLLTLAQFMILFSWFSARKHLANISGTLEPETSRVRLGLLKSALLNVLESLSILVQTTCGGILFCIWVFGFLWAFPFLSGGALAAEIIVGRRSFNQVTIITEGRFLMSDQVTEHYVSDNIWIYQSQDIDIPDTNHSVPSLQYIGEYQGYVYVLDLGFESAHAIPSSAILQMVFASGQSKGHTALDFGKHIPLEQGVEE